MLLQIKDLKKIREIKNCAFILAHNIFSTIPYLIMFSSSSSFLFILPVIYTFLYHTLHLSHTSQIYVIMSHHTCYSMPVMYITLSY